MGVFSLLDLLLAMMGDFLRFEAFYTVSGPLFAGLWFPIGVHLYRIKEVQHFIE